MPRHFVPRLNSIQATTLLTLATVGVALSSASGASAAGFSGPYAPGNWTFSTLNFPSGTVPPNLPSTGPGNGSVDTTNAPTSIKLTGGSDDSGDVGQTDYTTTAAANGTVSFDWTYTNPDNDVQFDQLYILLNGSPISPSANPLSDVANANGTFSFGVSAGQTFGFRIGTDDNLGTPAFATFSNFIAPIPTPPVVTTPEPSSLAILPLMLGLGFVSRKRKSSYTANG